MPEFEILTPPIRIGIVSDTHLVNPARGIPANVLKHLQDCRIIFHAGDVCSGWVIERLSELAPVHAVHGNNDSWELQERLPRTRYYRIGTHRVGMLHGHVAKGQKPVTARNVARDEMRGVVDCVVYGHSHRPEIETYDELLLVNPGSPTQPRWAPVATMCIMDIDDQIHGRLIEV